MAYIHRDLTEVEKSKLRGATDAGVDWLFENYYRSEVASIEDLRALQAELNRVYAENSEKMVFGRTWAF